MSRRPGKCRRAGGRGVCRTGGKGGRKPGGGQRAMTVRVKTAKGRKLSSTRWLQRQLNDPYVAAAKQDGYRSRAAYKLIEIDEKYGLLTPGARVIDLGAAPGGWSQVAAARVQRGGASGQVIALDLVPLEPIRGVDILTADFTEDDALRLIRARLAGHRADLVLSDMAAPATGHRQTDHLRIMGLCELALDFALEVLAPGGAFLAKVLQGGTERELLNRMKRHFAQVRHVKPRASRAGSAELYVLAMGFRGA